MIFLVWNTFNDPLFGWLSARYLHSVEQRLRSLSICLPFFSLSSLLFWFPWSTNISFAFQLTLSLCLYDTFLTMFELNFNALLTDVPLDERRGFIAASTFGHALGKRKDLVRTDATLVEKGSSSLFVCHYFWSEANLRAFRLFVTALTLTLIFVSMRILRSVPSNRPIVPSRRSTFRLSRFVVEIFRRENCFIFTVVNLLQVGSQASMPIISSMAKRFCTGSFPH